MGEMAHPDASQMPFSDIPASNAPEALPETHRQGARNTQANTEALLAAVSMLLWRADRGTAFTETISRSPSLTKSKKRPVMHRPPHSDGNLD